MLFEFGFVALSLVLTTDRASGAVIPGYQGCFKDSRNEIRLSEHQATVRGMTVHGCNALCFSQAFMYAATKDGKECFCGDLEIAVPKPDEDSLCNVPCTADMTAKCGGKNAFSLYSTGIKEDDIDNVDELEIGCVTDSEDIRLIPEHKTDLLLTNTPKRCIAYCRALGYPHAGTQYAQECYCGLARKTYPTVDGCDLPCVGDPSQYCGGHWKANLYSTGITKPPPGIATRGCFKYNKSSFVTRKVIDKMNPNKCASNCYINAFEMAFIHNGVDCLCGKSLPASRLRAAGAKCDIICIGDEKSKCGGGSDNESYMSAYTTGVVGDPILGKLVGCYKDENNDLLTGPKKNLGAKNSIALCIATCIELGFAFAGLRNTFECQCSQTSPKRTPVKIVPDYECASPCPQFQMQSCGAPLFTAIHRTGVTPSSEEECITSVSRINGGRKVCGGQILLVDDFKTLDTNKWEHSVKISGEDAEFVSYSKKTKNIYIENEKLVIKPTLIKDKIVKYGTMDLKGCTADPSSMDCATKAKSYHILPPVESGQICTRRSFNFKYGIITVRAKFPKGDWVIPQIWLKPVTDYYGKGYMSGKLIVATARGNTELTSPEGTDIGAKLVESGFEVSSHPHKNIRNRMVTTLGSEPWYNDFHNYSITWTDDTVLFYIDGNILNGIRTLYNDLGKTLAEEMGYSKHTVWSNGTLLAPFDQEFYLCIGLSVGGIRSFPDDSVSSGFVKPWKNSDVKSRLKFYLSKKNWLPTWSADTKLEVDGIVITAY